MSATSAKGIERLRWQCRRGLLELDCIFQDYLERHYPTATEEERAQFRALLQQQDPDLQAWLLHSEPAPARFAHIVHVLGGG